MKRWEIAFRFVGVGWFVGVSILLGVLGGLWLDKRLNSQPAFTIAGLMLGIVVAFYGVYRMIIPMFNGRNNKKDDEDKS